jgi:hypothetical protein
MLNLTDHLKLSIERAERHDSKLNDFDVFPVFGMSGRMGRALMNNICEMPGTRYLEIGLWQGSTFCSSLYRNRIRAVGCDNWSEFNGPKEVFRNSLGYFIGENSVSVADADCWTLDLNEKFNVLFYDGEHSTLSQYRALVKFGRMMDDEFILIVDDLNSPEVFEGTELAINDLGYDIVHQSVLGADRGHTDEDGWWNGMAALVLRKTTP